MSIRRIAGQALGITPREIERASVYQDLDGTYVLGQANDVGKITDLYNVELGPDPLRNQYGPISEPGSDNVRPGYAIVNGEPMNLHQRYAHGHIGRGLGPLEKEARFNRQKDILAQGGHSIADNAFHPEIRNKWRAAHGMPPATPMEDFLAYIGLGGT